MVEFLFWIKEPCKEDDKKLGIFMTPQLGVLVKSKLVCLYSNPGMLSS